MPKWETFFAYFSHAFFREKRQKQSVFSREKKCDKSQVQSSPAVPAMTHNVIAEKCKKVGAAAGFVAGRHEKKKDDKAKKEAKKAAK